MRNPFRPGRLTILVRLKPETFKWIAEFAATRGVKFTQGLAELAAAGLSPDGAPNNRPPPAQA